MTLLGLYQMVLGGVALAAAISAMIAICRRSEPRHLLLTAAGISGAMFFLSVPGVEVEIVALSLLTAAAGFLLATEDRVSIGQTPFDPDSTATRRLE